MQYVIVYVASPAYELIGPFETQEKAISYAVNKYGFSATSTLRVWTVRSLKRPDRTE